MNWLAHLRLSPTEPLLRLGNLAGDFVRGVDLTTLPPVLQAGIAQHRAIDRFVDAHPLVARSRARLSPPFRRFGGVLVDVYFDHFLARDWHVHGDGRPLRAFVDDVHEQLREHVAALPPRLAQAVPLLQREDWLGSYAHQDGIDAILRRMSGRVARANPLGDGGVELRLRYAAFEADFAAFWPELHAASRTIMGG